MLLQCCAGKDSAEGHRTTERLHALAATRERRLTEKQEAKAASEAAECTHAPQTTPYRRDDRRLVPDGRWRSGSEQHQQTLLLQQEEQSQQQALPMPSEAGQKDTPQDTSLAAVAAAAAVAAVAAMSTSPPPRPAAGGDGATETRTPPGWSSRSSEVSDISAMPASVRTGNGSVSSTARQSATDCVARFVQWGDLLSAAPEEKMAESESRVVQVE